jgi:hypothetical protein
MEEIDLEKRVAISWRVALHTTRRSFRYQAAGTKMVRE